MKRTTNASDPATVEAKRPRSSEGSTEIEDGDGSVGIQGLNDPFLLNHMLSFLDPLSHMNFLLTSKYHSKVVPMPPPPPSYKVIYVVMTDTSISEDLGWRFYADTVEGVIEGANHILNRRRYQYKKSNEMALYLQWIDFDTTKKTKQLCKYDRRLNFSFQRSTDFSHAIFRRSKSEAESMIKFKVPIHNVNYDNDKCFLPVSDPNHDNNFRLRCLCLRRKARYWPFVPDDYFLSIKSYFKGSKAERDAIKSNALSRLYFTTWGHSTHVIFHRDGVELAKRVKRTQENECRYNFLEYGQHWVRGPTQAESK